MQMSFSISQVCETTHIGKTKIYQAINAGELRAKKYGKRTIVLKEDLDAFLSQLNAYPTCQGGKE